MSASRRVLPGLGLGIDAGGTRTRWALAAPDGTLLGEGEVAGLSALQMGSTDGREAVLANFTTLAQAVLALGRPLRVHAGLTGFGGDGEQLLAWLAGLLDLAVADITVCNDIEIAYLASFAPGAGYLVYAGTGSIAAYIDAEGGFHRAGGHGVALDDGGGGYWIAREALRHIWRDEDESPGQWRASPLACAVFDHLGGSDWAQSRQFIYGRERGEVGKLALVVAGAAEADPLARAILVGAGQELARLALALVGRFGPRPIAVAGRAASLHPLILASMRAALPTALSLNLATGQAHVAAARLAAGGLPSPLSNPAEKPR